MCMFLLKTTVGVFLQEKPARPPCGITMPGCISMTTPQRESLLFSSRTSSTPCSLTPASSSCSGTRWKGRSYLCFNASHRIYLQGSRFSYTHWHLCASYVAVYTANTDRYFLVYRKQNMCCHRRCCPLLGLADVISIMSL